MKRFFTNTPFLNNIYVLHMTEKTISDAFMGENFEEVIFFSIRKQSVSIFFCPPSGFFKLKCNLHETQKYKSLPLRRFFHGFKGLHHS